LFEEEEDRMCWAKRLSFERRMEDMQSRWAIISQASKGLELVFSLLQVRKLAGSYFWWRIRKMIDV
jgi:hypothetical protein